MQLSVILTVPTPDAMLEGFCSRLAAAAWILTGDDYEIIVSTACELPDLTQFPNLSVIRDREGSERHALAAAAGSLIFWCRYSAVEIPEWLLPFYALINESGADVVYGVPDQRSNPFPRWLGRLLAKTSIFRAKATPAVTSMLMTAKTRDLLLLAPDAGIFTGQRPLPLSGLQQIPFAVTLPVEHA